MELRFIRDTDRREVDFGDETTGTRVLPFSTFCREAGLP